MVVSDLTIGTSVCRLDRPWEATSLPLQSVELTSEGEFATIRGPCEFVFIDARQQIAACTPHALSRNTLGDSRFKNAITCADTVALPDELPRARQALKNASTIVDRIFEDITSGRDLSIEYVEQAVLPLVASILRSAEPSSGSRDGATTTAIRIATRSAAARWLLPSGGT